MNSIVIALNAAQALINWIASRGIARDRIQDMLNQASALDVDITSEVVQAELDATGVELDETQDLIDRN